MIVKTIKGQMLAKSLLSAVILALSGNATASIVIGDIIATYVADGGSSFTIENTSGFDLTNVVFTGDGGGSFVGTLNANNVAPGHSVITYFGQTGTPFQKDYDDFYNGGENNVYTLTAHWHNQTVTASFTPLHNLSDHFVGFLGNEIGFNDADWDVSAKVALITAATSVPEADQSALLLLGLPMLAWAARRKSSQNG